jgi:hypothetical protein
VVTRRPRRRVVLLGAALGRVLFLTASFLAGLLLTALLQPLVVRLHAAGVRWRCVLGKAVRLHRWPSWSSPLSAGSWPASAAPWWPCRSPARSTPPSCGLVRQRSGPPLT